MDALPEIVPNWGELATTDPKSFLDLELPVAGIAGDQQSALFGQTCFDVGDSKCTFGTGSFILTNTGSEVVRSDAGLLSTAAWKSPDGDLTYALEGAIFVTGAAVQWLRDGLQIVGSAAETAAIAATVDCDRRRGVRAGADRARRSPLGPARPRARSSASPGVRRAPTSSAPPSRRSPSRSATSPTRCRPS